MREFFKSVISSQTGYALPAVLGLLVIGGLTIAPVLSYAATTLNSSRIITKHVNGLYAADAGVEDTLWCLINSTPPSEQLPEDVNQMAVALQTEDKGNYSLYFGELIESDGHSEYLDVDGEMVWNEEAQAYQYTITVTWQPGSGEPVIHLEGVGVRLPIGYSYQTGSASSFAGNLSPDEPDEVLDGIGAYLLTWDFGPPEPSVTEGDPIATQTFCTTGTGDLEGNYTWVVANRDDIGAVSEITGALYQITATATRPENNEVTARIVVDVLMDEGTAFIVSWQILR